MLERVPVVVLVWRRVHFCDSESPACGATQRRFRTTGDFPCGSGFRDSSGWRRFAGSVSA